MSPPWGERMKPATSCTSRPRRCPIPCGRNTLVTALAIDSSGLQRVMSASRSSSARSRWARRDRKEHTSELQSHSELVCRLLLEKKKTKRLIVHVQGRKPEYLPAQ